MPYQSIYAGGNFTPTLATPLKYVAPTITPKFNLGSVNDVPTLNKALRGGQISTQQWNQRFQQLQKAPPKIQTGILPNLNPISNQSAIRQATINPIIDSAKAAAVDTKNAVITRAQALAAPTSTQAQRTALINNQKVAAQKATPAETAALKQAQSNGFGRGAKTTVAVQKQIAQGATPKQVIATANKGTAAGKVSEGKAINAALNITGLDATGEGILAKGGAKVAEKTLGKAIGAARAGAGRDATTNALIDTQRAQTALKQAKISSLTGKAAVDEAKTQRIPVVSPNETAGARTSIGSTAIQNADRTSIPVKGTSTQTVGKVVAPPKNYIKQSDALSKAYEKESAGLQNVASSHAQQVLQDKIDLKYGKLQQDLDTAHGQTSVNFKGKTTKVGQTGPALPRSALDNHPRYQPNESPLTASTPETKPITVSTPKASETAPKAVTEPTTGTNVSGSSLRTQAKAVEVGMKSEAESTGATYNTVSHKEEAAKAAQLVEENPTKARSIAMGARGDNASHEAAVYHAVANKAIEDAKKSGDYSEVTALANSPRHTAVSEAAQKLGAEGYNANPHDPINIMNDLAKTREAAVTKRAGKPSVAKATTEIKKEVTAAAPRVSRQDWHSFIEGLKC